MNIKKLIDKFKIEEAKRVLFHRIFWGVFSLLLIFLPILIESIKPELKLVEESVCIDEYYSGSNGTYIDVELTFNREIYSGYAEIDFYDKNGVYLGTKNIYMYSSGKMAYKNSVYVNGKAEKYEIVSYDFEVNEYGYSLFSGLCLLFVLPSIIIFISTLLICYKKYQYGEKIISVYSGFYHHILRIDGIKYDEHNTIYYFTPIKLSTTMENGDNIEATITLANRASVKLNNKLMQQQQNLKQ